MKSHDWTAIVVISILIVMFSPRLWAHHVSTWHPDQNNTEVVVMVAWTKQMPVPCGKHKRARACAVTPSNADIPWKAKLCEITHPGFTSVPSHEQLIELGRLFDTCLILTGSRKIAVRFLNNGSSRGVEAHDSHIEALPCGIKIAPKARTIAMAASGVGFAAAQYDPNTSLSDEDAYRWGHEVAHCWKGHWHD
jgi:hypothetical protein